MSHGRSESAEEKAGSVIRVQMDEEDYRLVGPGEEEGELVAYGQPAALMVGDAVYYALVSGQGDTPTVYRVDTVTVVDSEGQEVNFEFPEDEEDDDGEDEEDDGEEDEEDDDDDEGDAPEVIEVEEATAEEDSGGGE